MPPLSHAFDRLVQSQLGVVSHAQLVAHGWSQKSIEHGLGTGRLVMLHACVYRLAGSPETFRSSLVAACLACGPDAVVSHRAAARVWGLLADAAPVEVTVPNAQCPVPKGVKLHRSLDLVPAHRTRRDHVALTNVPRTLVDSGAVLPLPKVRSMVDAAVVNGLVSFPALHAMVAEVGGRGRRGVGVLRAVLDDRPLGERRPESVLEPVVARICRDFGITRVHYQFEVIAGGRRFRLDFAVPHVKLGLEVDGLVWHGTRERAVLDRERRRLLKSAGWDLLEYTAKEIYRRPAAVAREIAAEVGRREKLLAALGLPAA